MTRWAVYVEPNHTRKGRRWTLHSMHATRDKARAEAQDIRAWFAADFVATKVKKVTK
jgi:hypothetical protein